MFDKFLTSASQIRTTHMKSKILQTVSKHIIRLGTNSFVTLSQSSENFWTCINGYQDYFVIQDDSTDEDHDLDFSGHCPSGEY